MDIADLLKQAIGSTSQEDLNTFLDQTKARLGNEGRSAQYSAPDPETQSQIDAALSSFMQSPGGEAVFRHLVQMTLWRETYVSPLQPLDRDARMEFAAMRSGENRIVEYMIRCAMRHRDEKPLPPR